MWRGRNVRGSATTHARLSGRLNHSNISILRHFPFAGIRHAVNPDVPPRPRRRMPRTRRSDAIGEPEVQIMVKTLSNRWVGAFATGAMALASFAPMAHAGHHEGNGPKYKRVIYDDRGWGNWGNWGRGNGRDGCSRV